jgi:hypothetical protein
LEDIEEGFEYGEAGGRAFTETYGLLEKVTVIEPAASGDNGEQYSGWGLRSEV